MFWKKNKYRAKRVQYENFTFASQLEAAVYQLLKLRENAGEIELIQTQATVLLTKAEIKYIPDFKCLDLKTNTVFYVESKGYSTPEWNIKKRLWRYYGPANLEIWKGTHKNPHLAEIIEPILD